LVGTSFAKAFALANNLPLIEVNHMQAHILAHFIEDNKPEFPVFMPDGFGWTYSNCVGQGLF